MTEQQANDLYDKGREDVLEKLLALTNKNKSNFSFDIGPEKFDQFLTRMRSAWK
jgi:hypothetical protein